MLSLEGSATDVRRVVNLSGKRSWKVRHCKYLDGVTYIMFGARKLYKLDQLCRPNTHHSQPYCMPFRGSLYSQNLLPQTTNQYVLTTLCSPLGPVTVAFGEGVSHLARCKAR